MRFNDIVTSVMTQFDATNRRIPLLLGPPGGGKSAAAMEIAKRLKQKFHDAGQPCHVEIMNASHHEPCDVLGIPELSGDFVRWVPAQMFWNLRKGVGPCVLVLEEFSDAAVPMQNALCSVLYDRRAGQLELSEDLYIIATGNRTEDKSGANRITTKLANRVFKLDFKEHIDDWVKWALSANLPPVLIQFLRFRPELLSKFDPNQFANPTPRAWERVGMIPIDLSTEHFFEHVKGDVGEGAAAEFAGFVKVYKELPDLEEILKKPKTATVPTSPATLYALSGALARKGTESNIDNLVTYLERLAPEFSVMTMKDLYALNPKIHATSAFARWATKNQAVLM